MPSAPALARLLPYASAADQIPGQYVGQSRAEWKRLFATHSAHAIVAFSCASAMTNGWFWLYQAPAGSKKENAFLGSHIPPSFQP